MVGRDDGTGGSESSRRRLRTPLWEMCAFRRQEAELEDKTG